MADEENKISDEDTVKLLKFIEENPEILKSSNRNTRQRIKEQLRDHLGKYWRLQILQLCLFFVVTSHSRDMIKITSFSFHCELHVII